MPELNDRAVALLERLVELQSAANARQEQALATSERQYAEARRRSDILGSYLRFLAGNDRQLFKRADATPVWARFCRCS